NGELMMRYVRKSAGTSIGVNDLIVTSGMKSLYPPGIVIGRVKEVRSREYSTSLELVLVPIIDVTKVEYVFILGIL
ncbi:MAG: rod shape-determining protein MreC, partial [Spirochaetaceae bacterium]|nr:rod shape-determining protein MreC [Spirochaetaceae bacterium]